MTWAERLAALLASNRAALDKALSSQSSDDWDVVVQTGKAVSEFYAAHKSAGSPPMNTRINDDGRVGERAKASL